MRLRGLVALVALPLARSLLSARRRRPLTPCRGFFDDLKARFQWSQQEVNAQHILVGTRMAALQIERALEEEGVSPESVGRAAQKYSSCGSAKKTPDAQLRMLRGRPGELVFKRGEMAKAFETAAFEGPVGALQVVETQFGHHVLLVNSRSGEEPS
mmetsp:Transcript_19065/g.56621  ORF Transcript_19065/g.56621 Transcript_19065/m.56621 type:complete len:156 (+) Transcript_19065:239-706(+)